MGNKRGSRGHGTLKQVEARNDITEKMTVEQNLDENEGKDMDMWKKNIKAKGIASGKTLRQGHAQCFLKTTMARRPRWLEENEKEISRK